MANATPRKRSSKSFTKTCGRWNLSERLFPVERVQFAGSRHQTRQAISRADAQHRHRQRRGVERPGRREAAEERESQDMLPPARPPSLESWRAESLLYQVIWRYSLHMRVACGRRACADGFGKSPAIT